MKSKLAYLYLFLFFLSVLGTACFGFQRTAVNKNTSSQYNPKSTALHPKFRVFHDNNSRSKLYIKLYTKELKFTTLNKERVNKSVVKLHYTLKPSYRTIDILDSATVFLNIRKQKNQTNIVTFLEIPRPLAENYLIEVKLYDVFGNKSSVTFVNVDNADNNNRQNYLIKRFSDDKPFFSGWVNAGEKIKFENNQADKNLRVQYYKPDPKMPSPPFSENPNNYTLPKADTTWLLPNTTTSAFTPDSLGIYNISGSSNKEKGLFLSCYDEYYPEFKTSKQLAEGLRYLVSDEDYLKIKRAKNIKLAVDNFWLKAGGSTAKAKELIKIWYNRANYSNYYFSSRTEGWKSDRGMIYMMFGPPQTVNTTDGAERWTYTNNQNIAPIYFLFLKNEKSGFANDYTLKHELMYRTYWFEAVDSWRAGKVYYYKQ